MKKIQKGDVFNQALKKFIVTNTDEKLGKQYEFIYDQYIFMNYLPYDDDVLLSSWWIRVKTNKKTICKECL